MLGPAPPPWLSPAFIVWARTVAPWVADWRYLEENPDFNHTFDVALHLGTLVASRRRRIERVDRNFVQVLRRFLDMELQRTVRSHDADRHNFSNNENLWINIQHDPDEARSQLVALRRSVLKLTGEASTQLQLLPGSGRLRTAGSQPIEAVCDAESLLVWSIAATPNIGSLKVWEYDAKGGDWRSLADAQQRAREPSARLMRFTSLPMEKTLSLN